MDSKLRQDLDKLLKKKDLFYQITLIKRDQKSFTTHEIRSSVEKNRQLVDIYNKTDQIIKSLDISEQNVCYYTELALQYSAYGFKELKKSNLIRLYLLCYVHHRFLKINDHLIASFSHRLNEYVNNADEYQRI